MVARRRFPCQERGLLSDMPVLQAVFSALKTAILLGLPFAVISLVIGFLAGVFQTGTSIQDQSISTVPRLVGVGFAALILGPWVMRTLVVLTQSLFGDFLTLLNG